MLGLSLVFVAMAFAAYGACAASARDRVISRPRVLAWMRRAFVALGAKPAVAER